MTEGTNYAKIYLHGDGKPCKVKGSDSLTGYCGEANARLIAAAPELLEACKDLVSACETASPVKWLEAVSNAGIKAKAAIAKAEGKQ